MKFVNREALKYIGIFAVILVIAGVVYVGSFYFSPEQRAERQVIRGFEELERRMREDPYGGETPEETLELFISALEAGDLELASKYFLVDDQEEELIFLKNVKGNGFLDVMISDLKKLETGNRTDEKAFFLLTDEKDVVTVQVVVAESKLSGKWKIISL